VGESTRKWILHGNIQCIRQKTGRLEVELQKEAPDIICLSEHWLKKEEISSISLEGYEVTTHFCREKYKNGGVIIFTKYGTKCSPISNINSVELEFECVGIIYEGPYGKSAVLCVYRAPSGDLKGFIEGMSWVLQQVSGKSGVSGIVACGDMNVNFMVESRAKQAVIDMFNSFNMERKVWVPTRITSTTSTCIDNVFSNLHGNGMTVEVKDPGLSDHYFQMISYKQKDLPKEEIWITKRCFKQWRIEDFITAIASCDWRKIYDSELVNDMFDEFWDKFSKIFEKSFPIVKVKVKTKRNQNRWYTDELRRMAIELNEAKESMKWVMSDQSKKHHDKLKRKYANQIDKEKRKENDRIIAEAENKAKAAWTIVDKVKGKIKKTEDMKLEDGRGNTTVDPQGIANRFVVYFGEAAGNLVKTRQRKTEREVYTASQANKVIFLTPLTAKEFYDIADKVCRKKSAGADGVPGNILKQVIVYMMPIMTHIINASFEQGQFPSKLKTAKIVPIFKKGNRALVENYRPVSVLSIFSKMMERAFCTRVVTFLEKENVMNKQQHGFTKRRSTTSAVSAYVNDILKALDQKKKTLGIFYDLSKAYDTINHKILLEKLRKIGIAGVANEWVKSFLSHRKQAVHIRSQGQTAISEEFINEGIGLPQGSTASPLLFTIFTNDLPTYVNKGSLILFADDTSHLITAETREEVIETANVAVKQMEKWCEENDLFLNKNKTVTIQFGTSKKIVETSPLIRLNHCSIRNMMETEFLGMKLDRVLDWGDHVNQVCAKVAAGCFLIKRLMRLVNKETVRQVYYANIQSHLAYGIIIWGNSRDTPRVFKLQKRAVRNMAGASMNPCADVFYKDSAKPLFLKFKLMTVPSLYMYHTIKFIKENSWLIDKKEGRVQMHDTRNKVNFNKEVHRLKMYSKGPVYAGGKLYNRLPKRIKKIACETRFNTALKLYFIEKCFYSVDEYMNCNNDDIL
jgi:hypothetical protein